MSSNGDTPSAGILSLDEFRKRARETTRKTREVYIEELGGSIVVRGLRVGDQEEAERAATKYNKDGSKHVDDTERNVQIIRRGVENPKLDATDAALIKEWNIGTALKVVRAIMELSGLEVDQAVPAGGMAGAVGFSVRPVTVSTGPVPESDSSPTPSQPDKADGSSPTTEPQPPN